MANSIDASTRHMQEVESVARLLSEVKNKMKSFHGRNVGAPGLAVPQTPTGRDAAPSSAVHGADSPSGPPH